MDRLESVKLASGNLILAVLARQSPPLLEHCVRVVGDGRHGLQHIPVLDDLAIHIKAEDIDPRGFLPSPVKVTHMYKRKVAINRDAFHLAGNALGLLDVTHDAVWSIRKKWIVLD